MGGLGSVTSNTAGSFSSFFMAFPPLSPVFPKAHILCKFQFIARTSPTRGAFSTSPAGEVDFAAGKRRRGCRGSVNPSVSFADSSPKGELGNLPFRGGGFAEQRRRGCRGSNNPSVAFGDSSPARGAFSTSPLGEVSRRSRDGGVVVYGLTPQSASLTAPLQGRWILPQAKDGGVVGG